MRANKMKNELVSCHRKMNVELRFAIHVFLGQESWFEKEIDQ